MAPADFAVPYDAPKVVRTMEHAQPMAPKKDWEDIVSGSDVMGEVGYVRRTWD